MTDAPLHHEFQVVSTAEYVPFARRETAKVLSGWGLDAETVATACLIVTELVTNVVQHAAVLSPTAAVHLGIDAAALTLVVADAHPFKPKALPTAHDLGGRGLHLVKALVAEFHGSHEVTADETSGGKRIVIRLPLALLPA
ncbi:ATP-binding protein [Streptomyces formicae]|uniref:ATP-binding protein n=1 Tax=Streptomyces formicae TaxID=1616117 RepID=A0ABY3WUI8_9ACTN|nr:ATP-binding protein [Streptomyces formicae]UNM15760.1 ATP-binding protein [Streptomyces formicae]